MSKLFISFIVLVFVVYVHTDSYTDEFDNIDIDEILANKRLVDNYLYCLKTGKKCTPDAQKAKELLPNALQTKCSKCTDAQKEKTQKIVEWAIKNKPDDFLELEKQYDPDHQYRNTYADELRGRNIVLPPLK
ncbi:hypothetical protein RN001_001952 [Aquatica leii]|uniref:Chemosensory protein n=1 Tax=Aquatica leii TaxID=1421715 RepID=A0AAN7PP88_9COLE|nr:hypothetical protein RN001_001952 [Aquatica leii]